MNEHSLYELTEKLHNNNNKPFWIWNVEDHKGEDIRTNGSCCFNHIIGLPPKDSVDKPLYDYQSIIYASVVTQNGNVNFPSNKHLWIKKATGLGISEFMLGSWPGFA